MLSVGKVLLLSGLLVSTFSCRESLMDGPVNEYGNNNTENTAYKTRSVDEVKELALQFYGMLGEKTDFNASATTPQKSQLELDVFTLNQISNGEDDSETIASINKNFEPKRKLANDTLLYYVGFPNSGGVILSGNEESTPLLAVLDDENFSFKDALSDTENNEGILSFLLTAAEYNKNPEAFGDILNSDETDKSDPEAFRIRWNFWKKRRNDPPKPVYLVDYVAPKVKVEWRQGYPYNKYTPNNSPTGCVATALAQALTVTRNWKSFKGIDLDYDDLIKFKHMGKYNGEKYYYFYRYQKQADKVARLIERIGYHVGMKYGPEGSSANMNFAVGRMFRDYPDIAMNVSKDKRDIKSTLKYHDRGIVLIASYPKKRGRKNNIGHAYIADGYMQYSNGSDLIHVNWGWGSQSESKDKYERGYNGYYLSNLMAPHWIGQTPKEQLDLPHAWEFYCVY